jgi:hypothetical protein
MAGMGMLWRFRDNSAACPRNFGSEADKTVVGILLHKFYGICEFRDENRDLRRETIFESYRLRTVLSVFQNQPRGNNSAVEQAFVRDVYVIRAIHLPPRRSRGFLFVTNR